MSERKAPEIEGVLRRHMIKVPESIQRASGIRIARVSGKSTDVLFRSVAEKVIGVADKAGIVSEDELRDKMIS